MIVTGKKGEFGGEFGCKRQFAVDRIQGDGTVGLVRGNDGESASRSQESIRKP